MVGETGITWIYVGRVRIVCAMRFRNKFKRSNDMKIDDCERCGSKIVKERFGQQIELVLSRHTGDGRWEHDDAYLCSMCWDELWEWVFDSAIDRSDKADPLPLDRMAENVDRHISDLVDILDQIEEAKE